ncbi:MAG: hypothetical protein H7Z16_14000 [Pyrinomonadaceae bacterium]|nr:hypothetical protein [Pyrinomonadaceae bacterium]
MSRRFATVAFLFVVLLSLSLGVGGTVPQEPCSMGTAFRGCRACGNATSLKGQKLNVLKNRDDAATDVKTLTIADIRKPSNNDTFDPNTQVEVTGYVASVEKGGFKEGCNCGKGYLRDIHINVVAKASEKNKNRKFVIMEISPRWQEKLGFDPSNYDAMLAAASTKFKNKWVTFRGWLLYDVFHESETESTNPGGPTNWRATPWEVHPVTSFTVLAGPPL